MKKMRYLRLLRKKVKQFGSQNIIYIDESGFQKDAPRLYGWAPRGQRIYGNVSSNRRKAFNLIMAQRGKGKARQWLAPHVFEENCTAPIFNGPCYVSIEM